MMKRNVLFVLVAALLVLGFALPAGQTSLAQSYPVFGYYAIGLCSTVDYDAVAAKTLNMAPADLRLALVSGQFLEDIARNQNVTLDTVKRALLDAHFAEIDQAVSDGLLDPQQAKQLKTLLTNASQVSPRSPLPYGMAIYPVYGLPPDITSYNFQAVKILMAAAQSLDLKCPDLAKELQNNRSLVALTTSRGGQIGAVIDAMIKTYQMALDQDVKEQLITAAQAKGLRVQLAVQVTSLVNQAGQPVLVQMLTLPGYGMGNGPFPGVQPMAAQPGSAGGAQSSATGPLPPVRAPQTLPGTTVSVPPASVSGTPAPTAAAQ